MSLLRIFDNGQFVSEIVLDPHKEYIAGRSESCDIKLRAEPGISRQHFKLTWHEGSGWKLQVHSQYGEVYFNDEQVQSLDLNESIQFKVPPFEFEFVSQIPQVEEQQPTDASDDEVYNDDRTVVGVRSEQAYFRVINANGNVLRFFKLEGEQWVAGRDTNCSLFLDFNGVSRKQFEVMLKNKMYFCRDLGSSNGSLLNGTALTTNWTHLKSGDVISLADMAMIFELRDSEFEQKISEFSEQRPMVLYQPQLMTEPPVNQPTSNYYAPAYDDLDQNLNSTSQLPPNIVREGKNQKVFYFRVMIAVLILGGAYFYNQQTPNESHMASTQNPNKKLSGFDALKPEEQQFVRTSHRLAKELYMQGRYEMARQELIKIYQFVSEFEDSKELESASLQAIQLQQDKASIETAEKEKLETERKIVEQVAACKNKISSTFSSENLEECLSPILALNPEHPAILSLRTQVEQMETEREIKSAEKAEYQALVRRHQRLYEKAQQVLAGGASLEAKKAFETVVKSGLPDPSNLKTEAKRQIASIEKNLIGKQVEFERQADQAYRKGEMKVAIQSLQKALVIDPANDNIEAKLRSYKSELTKQMQTLYQEGILEESVGEVDPAKIKWKRIIEQSVPDEEYYKKASIKLKKYGAF